MGCMDLWALGLTCCWRTLTAGGVTVRLTETEAYGGDEDTAGPEDGDGGVSGALFGFLIDLAGFGDKILEAQTPAFKPSTLPELDASP